MSKTNNTEAEEIARACGINIQHAETTEQTALYDPVALADAGFGDTTDTGDLAPVIMTETEVRALAAVFVDHEHTLDKLIAQIEACRV